MTLRAVVVGAGFAGEGHTLGLRAAGVEVVAMCGRTPEPAKAMAEKLGIAAVRFDWQAALTEFKPDIVAIATPAGPHPAITAVAAALGCHIMCDKPLAVDLAGAKAMFEAVEAAGVKHAYGTTSRYNPVFTHTQQLLAQGLIGQIDEIEYIGHMAMPRLLSHYWFHQLELGGGFLNNGFTHMMGQLIWMTQAQVQSATGQSRRLVEKVPVGEPVHDWRDFMSNDIDPAEAAQGEWRKVDFDTGFTIMTKLQMPAGNIANTLLQFSAYAPNPQSNYIAFYGSEGALHLSCVDSFWPNQIQHFGARQGEWTTLEIPQTLYDALPPDENFVYRDWNQLFLEFVADIRGEGYAGYPTFRDGYVDAQIIDIARHSRGWTEIAG